MYNDLADNESFHAKFLANASANNGNKIPEAKAKEGPRDEQIAEKISKGKFSWKNSKEIHRKVCSPAEIRRRVPEVCDK